MSEDYNSTHAKRWALSLDWIAPIADKAARILELGGVTEFTRMLDARWPNKRLSYYGDLRHGFSVDGCDLILAMEVAEHIHDLDTGEMCTQWANSGVMKMLKSSFSSLNPGGHLFLTTPNAASITVLHHVLNLRPGMIFRPHVREFSPYELDETLKAAGFEIVRRDTLDVWRNAISMREHAQIKKFIEAENYPAELRGEDTFCLARRPLEMKSASA